MHSNKKPVHTKYDNNDYNKYIVKKKTIKLLKQLLYVKVLTANRNYLKVLKDFKWQITKVQWIDIKQNSS